LKNGGVQVARHHRHNGTVAQQFASFTMPA
jgi:hypothetical protein